MRLGELLALRWDDVDLDGAASSSSAPSEPNRGPDQELAGPLPPVRRPRGRGVRAPRPRRLHRRDDYVFCSRLGRRLDGSAVRRRYKARARRRPAAAPLPRAAPRRGSLVARHADAHFVQAFLGHSRLTTTERYLHAKARPQDVDLVNRAFAPRAVTK